MDGLIFLIAVFAMGLDLHWVGKHTLFKGPWGPFLRWTGGIGIDRRQAGGLVQQVADQFKARDGLVIVVAPEGTRSRTEQWKSGFYRMAELAQVPISLGFMDYKLKRVGFGPSLMPSGDFDVPTTVALLRGSLYAVNARFGNPAPATADYWITRLDAPRG